MTNQPQNDHTLNIRLAELCKLPREWGSSVFPCVLKNRNGTLRLVYGGDGHTSEPWSPLEDERQAFRFVVKALGRMGCVVDLMIRDTGHMGVMQAVQILPSPELFPSYPDRIAKSIGMFSTIARPICLAALEAWEKLENRDDR